MKVLVPFTKFSWLKLIVIESRFGLVTLRFHGVEVMPFAVAVISAVPIFTALASPLVSMLTFAGLDDAHIALDKV